MKKINTITSLGVLLALLAMLVGTNIPSVYAAVRNFVQGGNSFSELGVLGTLDNFGLSFITNGTEKARIDSVGNVGIGTVSPEAKLNIVGGELWLFNEGQNPRIVLGDSGITGQYGFAQWDSLNDYYRIETDGTNGLKVKDNNVSIGNIFPSEPLIIGSGNTELLRVTNTGRVGVGTTNPNNTIQVANLINFNNTNLSTSLGYRAATIGAGVFGTFVGYQAGTINSGAFNTGIGAETLTANTTGEYNTANGFFALRNNTIGGNNTANGAEALKNNTTGVANTANGVFALGSNTDGDFNTAIGYSALASNRELFSTRRESNNTAVGFSALSSNTSGANNTALGSRAGVTVNSANANLTGSNNVFIGYNSGPETPTQISNSIAIGPNALVSKSNAMVLGGTGAYTVNVGIGTTSPNSKLQVVDGDIAITTQSNGMILKATDGPNCYRVTVNNDGVLTATLVTCP